MYSTFIRANNKCAGQTARVRRLIYDCCCHATKLDFLATMSIAFTLKKTPPIFYIEATLPESLLISLVSEFGRFAVDSKKTSVQMVEFLVAKIRSN